MLQLGSVTIDAAHEPPRPALVPPKQVIVLRRGVAGLPDYREDWGPMNWTPVRFVSSPNQGFVTGAQAESLMALYASRVSFNLITDLLKPLGGANDTYSAFFDPGETPSFVPADPGGNLYYFDMLLLVDV